MRMQGPPMPRKRRAIGHDQPVRVDPSPEHAAKILVDAKPESRDQWRYFRDPGQPES